MLREQLWSLEEWLETIGLLFYKFKSFLFEQFITVTIMFHFRPVTESWHGCHSKNVFSVHMKRLARKSLIESILEKKNLQNSWYLGLRFTKHYYPSCRFYQIFLLNLGKSHLRD